MVKYKVSSYSNNISGHDISIIISIYDFEKEDDELIYYNWYINIINNDEKYHYVLFNKKGQANKKDIEYGLFIEADNMPEQLKIKLISNLFLI